MMCNGVWGVDPMSVSSESEVSWQIWFGRWCSAFCESRSVLRSPRSHTCRWCACVGVCLREREMKTKVGEGRGQRETELAREWE